MLANPLGEPDLRSTPSSYVRPSPGIGNQGEGHVLPESEQGAKRNLN